MSAQDQPHQLYHVQISVRRRPSPRPTTPTADHHPQHPTQPRAPPYQQTIPAPAIAWTFSRPQKTLKTLKTLKTRRTSPRHEPRPPHPPNFQLKPPLSPACSTPCTTYTVQTTAWQSLRTTSTCRPPTRAWNPKTWQQTSGPTSPTRASNAQASRPRQAPFETHPRPTRMCHSYAVVLIRRTDPRHSDSAGIWTPKHSNSWFHPVSCTYPRTPCPPSPSICLRQMRRLQGDSSDRPDAEQSCFTPSARGR